jgi:hypothetical protein
MVNLLCTKLINKWIKKKEQTDFAAKIFITRKVIKAGQMEKFLWRVRGQKPLTFNRPPL